MPDEKKDEKKKESHPLFDEHIAFALFLIVLVLSPVVFLYFRGLAQFEPVALSFLQKMVAWWHAFLGPGFIILDTLFVGVILFLYIQILPLRWNVRLFTRSLRAPGAAVTGTGPVARRPINVARRWDDIKDRAAVPTAQNLRLSVIDADTLVDTFLKNSGFIGETMAERLQLVNPNEARSLQRVWEAHKLRNELVHTPGFPISPTEARSAVKAFEDFLREMGGL